MKRLAFFAVLLFALLVADGAQARLVPPPAPLSLASENVQNNPLGPPWCLNEDDWHQRVWTGSLAGTFAAAEHFCDPAIDIYNGTPWDGGGVGVTVAVVAVGTVDQLQLSYPGYPNYTPPLVQPAELLSSQIIGHGRNAHVENHYAACAYPLDHGLSSSAWMADWTMTLSGTLSSAVVTLTAAMFPFAGPPLNVLTCPSGQW